MQVSIFPVAAVGPGRLSTMPRPSGGEWLDDHMRTLRERHDVDVIVSLQTDGERTELDLTDEPEAARRHGISYHCVPIADFSVPEHSDVEALLDSVDTALAEGKHVAIHCRGGIGRSSLIAAAVLVRHGATPDEACATIGAARGREVPETPAQRAWIDERAHRSKPAGEPA